MDNLLKVYYREHPTLLLTFGYFIVTVIGVIYSYFFYAEFDIAILKFADISDFLLASILEPFSLAIFVGWLVFYFVSYKFDLFFRARFKGYGTWVKTRLKAKYTDPISFVLIMIIFTTLFVKDLAVDNANAIKSGDVDEYQVWLPTSSDLKAAKSLALLGSTTRFTYLYDVQKSQAIVIPVENVVLMSKSIAVGAIVEGEDELHQGETDKIIAPEVNSQ